MAPTSSSTRKATSTGSGWLPGPRRSGSLDLDLAAGRLGGAVEEPADEADPDAAQGLAFDEEEPDAVADEDERHDLP
ncbi:MAG TPA: hypothetical protein VG846_16310, partial [Actinomycetota bacterium]|nr:hypothetical protein [Actinomycetota bacterium]